MPENTDVTACPKDLDAKSKVVWRKTRFMLKKEERWRPEYSLLLERYVRAIEVARKARDRITEREHELNKERPRWQRELDANPEFEVRKRIERNLSRTAYTAWGSQGQLVPHPDLKTAREAERDANEYAKEMLLTPASRAKGGDETPKDKPKGGKFGGFGG